MREFSWKRLVLLTSHRLPADLLPLAMGAAALFGLEVLGWLVTGVWGVPFGHGDPDSAPWPFLVVLACWLTSARAFSAMHSHRAGTDWLLLPASSLEKAGAALVETQVVVPLVGGLLGLLLWLSTGSFGLPRIFGVWQAWGFFFVVNLIFLAGSTVFRRLSFIKTAALGLGFLIVMLALPLGVISRMDHDLVRNDARETLLSVIWHLGVFVLTPVAAIVFGYFRVKEKEAHHAVQ